MVEPHETMRPSSSAADPVRIAVVGAGLIGRRHIQLVRGSPFSSLTAIADPDPGVESFASEAGIRWFRSLDDVLADERPQGVILATPNEMHVPQGLQCIEAGVPVLVEKPIATTVSDGLRLAVAADRDDVPLLVGHHRRHSPLLTSARDVIASGRLGEVVGVLAMTLFAKPDHYFEAAPWRREPGGGPILINLIHDIDALRMLVGEVVNVRAIASKSLRHSAVEESVAVAMEFAGGAVGSLLLSDTAASPFSWEMTAGEDPVYPHYADRDCYVVAGTRGTLTIPSLRLTTADGAPSWHRRMLESVARPAPGKPLARQLEHFCAVIQGNAKPMVDGRDAVESLRVTLAVGESARTGQSVACGPADADPGARRP
jgi:predicted dehydrogenase